MRLTEIGVKELSIGAPPSPTVEVEDDAPKKSRKKKKADKVSPEDTETVEAASNEAAPTA